MINILQNFSTLKTTIEKLKNAKFYKKLFIFLDYDGTISPLTKDFRKSRVCENMLNLLKKIQKHEKIQLAIVTGRSADDIKKFIPIKNLLVASNHGLSIKLILTHSNTANKNEKMAEKLAGEKTEKFAIKKLDETNDETKDETLHTISNEYKLKLTEITKAVKQKFENNPNFKGVQIEEKEITLAIHYRCANGINEEEILNISRKILKNKYDEDFVVKKGKKVVEIVPNLEWNKGTAVEWILNEYFSCFKSGFDEIPLVIFAGDDRTDFDVFDYLENTENEKKIENFSIFVKNSNAAEIDLKTLKMPKFFAEGPFEIEKLLEMIIEAIE